LKESNINAGVADGNQIGVDPNVFADIRYFERKIIFNWHSVEAKRTSRERKDVMGIERLEFT
jgi:hypothetical protein